MIGHAVGDEVSLLCRAAGWMKEVVEFFDTLDSSSACWSSNFIHAQAAAQVGHDGDSQPLPTLRSLGWPGPVHKKYLELTQKLLVLNLWRASSSEELAPKRAGRKALAFSFANKPQSKIAMVLSGGFGSLGLLDIGGSLLILGRCRVPSYFSGLQYPSCISTTVWQWKNHPAGIVC